MENERTRALLAWYDAHKRTLPWRGVEDPYGVWVSEIMLQQTRVDTVLHYYPRFMERFPDLRTLAEAPTEDVLKLWEGLGYYSRARNLQQGARQVMEAYEGVMPREPQALRGLKGIGDYTAGAIASIAFGQRVAAVDGNVIRVITRLYGIRENAAAPDARRRIAVLTEALLPEDRPGDLNQALMDLGSAVCVPGTPDCEACPLRQLCAMSGPDEASGLPVLPERKKPKELHWRVWLIRRGDGVLMHPRKEKLLQGLWVFPMTTEEAVPELKLERITRVGEARHVFTHQVWQMEIYTAESVSDPRGDCRYVTAEEMSRLPLPTAMRVPAQYARDLLHA